LDGQKLATLRKDAGLSQVHLAKLTGLDPSAIAKLERGQQDNPKLSTLLALARELRCRVVDFAPELLAVPAKEATENAS
jgi:transcriptional regulator with XRE-family HTH domain